MLSDKGLPVSVASCGTDACERYKVPAVVIRLLTNKGIDVSSHVSTQMDKKLINAADLVIVMEARHLKYIETFFPEARHKTHLLKELVCEAGEREIPDPIGCPDEEYERTAEAIERYIQKLVIVITKSYNGE
jgi:protein-tyrosine phosphatase